MKKALLITGGMVVTLNEGGRIIPRGAVLIRDGIIEAVGTEKAVARKAAGARVLRADGRVIMPGFINAHMHLYSTFARGIVPKQPPATNFTEVLERLWFPLDKALNKQDIKYSALVPYIDCIRNGVTTIIDHHESQGVQTGVLDVLEDAARSAGVRSVFCLGVSDRYGKGREGVEENVRFVEKIQSVQGKGDDLVSAMFGLHALFTVKPETLKESADAARALGVGFHVHVAEALSDQEYNLKHYKRTPVQRLEEVGALGDQSIAVHGVHISKTDMKKLASSGTAVVHNPQSNMNNAVGIARVNEMLDAGILVGLGTDGMTSNMRDDVRVAVLAQRLRQKDPCAFFVEACSLLLENNRRIAGRYFGRGLGVLEPGAYGDVVVLEYDPPTPMNEQTFLGHFLFGLCGAVVETTVVGGRILMENRVLKTLGEQDIMSTSRRQAARFWKRF
ncbi:MAG: putative aminohydrolase SsnA [Kiritimatiellae bacterium]|nr:putative aminohydrolase SsnA [Kiritimatiellia bacterium]